MPTSHIIGTGSAVPQRVLANKDLERIVDTSDEWITRRTGIKERRIASKNVNESTTDMGSQAAKAAMQMAGTARCYSALLPVPCSTGSPADFHSG